MAEFKELGHGDMFNTKMDRFVKISDKNAIAVFYSIGTIHEFEPEHKVTVLYKASSNDG